MIGRQKTIMRIKLTPQEAWQRIAATSPKHKARGNPTMPEVTIVKDDIYVFGEGGSATITTAYEELPMVLGQWDEGDGVMPDALTELIDGYANQVAAWSSAQDNANTSKPRAKAKAASTRVDIPQMIDAKWGQWTPFNDRIRIDGRECPCGCVAMAVALILYYWGCQDHNGKVFHRGCMAVKSYKTDTLKKKIAALPPLAVFGYKDMTPDTPKTAEGKAAVAELLEYVGKACLSDYTEKSTSAYISKAYHALEDSIRLATKMGYIYASQLGEEAFAEKIYKSLLNGCPVIMSGRKTNDGCHCYVVDGYNAKTGLFHINFGWYGQFDGWYALSATGSSSAGYTINKTAITNIKPTYILGDVDGDGEIDIQDVMTEVQAINNGSTDAKFDINSDGAVDANDVPPITNHILGKEQL